MEPWKPLQSVRLEQKGFRGMRDVIDTNDGEASDLPLILHNCLSADPVKGGALVTRPPFQAMGGNVTATRVNLIYNYDRLDGTRDLLMVTSGAIYRFSGGAWVVYLSYATLSAAGIVPSVAGPWFAVTINGKLVVSDGVNTPWMYDGVTATLTLLSNCPVLYGQPTVYYAKLFGIKNTERSTLVWSEENDPTIGYEAGGYNNAWTLGQTSSEPITAILGTNESLFYWRAHSMGAIRGAVTPDFVNDGVHDGVSATVGTASYRVLQVDRTIYWSDAFGRPHYLSIGGDIQELYSQMQRKLDQQGLSNYIANSTGSTYGDGWVLNLTGAAGLCWPVYDPVLRVVGFVYGVTSGFLGAAATDNAAAATSSNGKFAYIVCFSHDTHILQSYWSFPCESGGGSTYVATIRRSDTFDEGIAIASAVSNVQTILFGSHKATYCLDYDVSAAAQATIPQFVIGPREAHADDIQLAFDRLDVSVNARPKTAAVGDGRTYEGQLGVALQTSNLQVSSELSTAIISGDAGLYPAGGTDQVQTAGVVRETQNSFGVAEEGRWARVLLRLVDAAPKYNSAYPLAIVSWTLTAMARTRAPASNIAPP